MGGPVALTLFPLLLAGLAGVDGAGADGQTRRRLHELRGRLGVREAPAPPSGVMQRLAWALAQVTTLAQRTLIQRTAAQLYFQRHDNPPTETSRDLALERFLPWWALQIKRGIRISDLPWEEEWRRQLPDRLGRGDPTVEELALIRTPFRTHGELWHAKDDFRSKSCPERTYLFIHDRGFHNGNPIASPSDPLEWEIALLRFCRGTPCGSMNARSLLIETIGPRLVDWIEQVHPDLSRLSFPQAYAASLAWHQSFGDPVRAHSPVPVQPQDEVLVTFPDGARILSLRAKRSLADEGESLQHCVGGYWARVRAGETLLWSYRDPAGVPILTLELAPGSLEVRQVHGFANLDLTGHVLARSTSIAQAALRMAEVWANRYVGSVPRHSRPYLNLAPFGLEHLWILNPDLFTLREFLSDEDNLPRWEALVEALRREGASLQGNRFSFLNDLLSLLSAQGPLRVEESALSTSMGTYPDTRPGLTLTVWTSRDLSLALRIPLCKGDPSFQVNRQEGRVMRWILKGMVDDLDDTLQRPYLLQDLSPASLRTWFAAQAARYPGVTP